jgi:TonB family protein
MPDHPAPEFESSNLQESTASAESDLGELAALFAAHGGGGLSPEVSADLALEIVLNEIVEQACLATGATGAAIVLVRDGEMVCRASSGANAPELGVPLGSESGLTAECVKTRQVQCCDDAQTDLRVDADASRSLGVRSVMIFPLLRNGEMAGLLEVFSSRPGAFGDRDELTLEALAHRILKNLDRANQAVLLSTATLTADSATNAVAPMPAAEPVELAAVAEVGASTAGSVSSLSNEEEDNNVSSEIAEPGERSAFDVVTMALVAAVVACAVLLGTLLGVRLGWRRATGVRGQVTRSATGTGFDKQNPVNRISAQHVDTQNGVARTSEEHGTNTASASVPDGVGNTTSADGKKKNTAAATTPHPAGSKDSFPPAGSLLVYENGKEVFRMSPGAAGETAKTTHSNQTGTLSDMPNADARKVPRSVPGSVPGNVQRASAVEAAGIVELAPAAAEGSLLHRVEPEYPEAARQQRIQGAVVLDVRIGRDGAIEDVKLVSGQPILTDAAIAAVKQWRFKPRMLKGQPVEMQTRVTLNFRMPA